MPSGRRFRVRPQAAAVTRYRGQGCREAQLAADATRALRARPWPGTIRELRSVLERALLLSGGAALERAAQRLGIPRSTLYLKLKRWGGAGVTGGAAEGRAGETCPRSGAGTRCPPAEIRRERRGGDTADKPRVARRPNATAGVSRTVVDDSDGA